MSALAVEAAYGTAANPLASIDELCPDCGRRPITAHLDTPDEQQARMAAQLLEPHDLAHWRSICLAICGGCSWIGSAYRPEREDHRHPHQRRR